MDECKCLTGGLHVDGRCLVCYRPTPDPIVGVDVGDGTAVRQSDVDAGLAVAVPRPGVFDLRRALGRAPTVQEYRDAEPRPDYDARIDWPERYTDGPI